MDPLSWLRKQLEGADVDLLREMVRTFAEMLMSAEADAVCGAPSGVPDPELVEHARRRRFTAEYKLRILTEAEAATRPGEVGALLRREGLYSSHLTKWRRQERRGCPRGAFPAARAQTGPSPGGR